MFPLGGVVMNIMQGDLCPPAPLRRDQALAFIIERIVRTGNSPSFGDIARELKVSHTRSKQLVAQLIEDGTIEKTPGAQRSFRVRDLAASRSHLDQALRRLGWHTANPMSSMQPPFPEGQLSMLPPFEHLSDVD